MFKNFFKLILNFFKKPAAQITATTNHVWREEWTAHLRQLFSDPSNFVAMDSANDVKKLHHVYDLLSQKEKIELFCAFIKEMCLYESSFNPLSESVDVGTKNNKDSWSVGLLQLSVIDQSNLGIRFGFSYSDLQDPIKNLTLGVAIMVNQIQKRGKIFIAKGETGNPGVYWAVIHPGGRYDKSQLILKATNALAFVHAPAKGPQTETKPKVDETPWLTWFINRLGWTEYTHDKELSKGWPLTKHCKHFKSVIGKVRAWCGMSLATALHESGYQYPEQCETAFEYEKCGTEIPVDGFIPKGALIVLTTSHVCVAYKDCSASDAYISVIGGNQSDSICVKKEPRRKIKAARWPIKKA